MPRKDPESRRAYMVEYRRRKIAEGYGKTLYARRRAKWENEKRYRKAIVTALDALRGDADLAEAVLFAEGVLSSVLKEAERRTKEAG